MSEDNLSKAELALIDRIVGAAGLAKFRNILWQKVRQAFGFSFHGTNLEYGFARATPDERSLAYLEDRIFILSDKTQAKLVGDIRWELLEGMRNVESIDEIKKRLDTIFEGNTVNTERIARTEVLNAMNAGRQSAYEESDVVHYKMWRAAMKNPRTAADSKRLNGQIQEVGNLFIDLKTGDSFMHPPNRPNCRCTMIPMRKMPENIVRKNGIMYAADEMVGKIEIDISSLQKAEKRVWVKPTSKRKGHYRKIKGAKKVEEVVKKPKVSVMIPNNVEEIITLEDMGVKGGLHKEESSVIKFKDGSYAMYKTADKDFVTSQFYTFGEVSAYKVSDIVGWDVVPETVSGDFGKGEGSIQKWIEGGIHPGETPKSDNWDLIKENHLDDLSKIFVLDMVNGNSDRHQANVVVKGDRVYMIDNEFVGDTREGQLACKALFNSIHEDYVGNSRMLNWIKYTSIRGFNDKFHERVVKNMDTIMKKKTEIVDYYTKNITSLEGRTKIERERILRNIKENFDYMEKYIEKVGEFA